MGVQHLLAVSQTEKVHAVYRQRNGQRRFYKALGIKIKEKGALRPI